MLKIALVDDHVPTLERFKNYFSKQADITICFSSESGLECIRKLNKEKILPDYILLDINMPKIDGIALSFYIKYKYQNIKVIHLTSYETEEVIRQSIVSKADGLIIKAMAESILYKFLFSFMCDEFYIDERIILSSEQKTIYTVFQIKL
jgi:DNA-binding NarL/FixJ family response regulator